MPTDRRTRASTLAALAAGWCAGFALLHLLWALGLDAGLGAAADDGMSGWFLVYDVVAGLACAAGVALALALPGTIGRDDGAARRLRGVVLFGGVVTAVRGAVGVGQVIWLGANDPGAVGVTAVWDPWFVLGGVLLVAAARAARR